MLTTSEDTLRDIFTKAAGKEGCVERVKKLRDFAFVHFTDRDDALRAMHNTNGNLFLNL